MEPQQTISNALKQVGRDADALAVLTTTDPWLIQRFGLIATEYATSDTRLEIAHKIKLAIDDPANGGPGLAKNYEVRKHVHPLQPDLFIYRAYDESGQNAGLMHWNKEMLVKTLVAVYVVRDINY